MGNKIKNKRMKHFTYGSGYPLALHTSVMFVPSRTTISLLVMVSTMTGGTVLNKRTKFQKQINSVNRKNKKKLLAMNSPTTCRQPFLDRIGSVIKMEIKCEQRKAFKSYFINQLLLPVFI